MCVWVCVRVYVCYLYMYVKFVCYNIVLYGVIIYIFYNPFSYLDITVIMESKLIY